MLFRSYKIKTDLPGHTDEVYCVDFVADKVVSGGRDRTVKMCVFSFFCSSCVALMSFRMQMEELRDYIELIWMCI